MHEGGCLCGRVRYEYSGDIDEVSMCHCKQCQKAQGSAFVAVAPVRSAGFRITSGASYLKEYRASPDKARVFCSGGAMRLPVEIRPSSATTGREPDRDQGERSMKYLCLCYYDVDALNSLTPSRQAEIGPACRPHDEQLRASEQLLVQGSLFMPDTWAHFIPKDGVPQQYGGPYLESKDQAGAFFLVEADSDDEARDVASRHAAANYGEHIGFAVEVRACESFETYDGRA